MILQLILNILISTNEVPGGWAAIAIAIIGSGGVGAILKEWFSNHNLKKEKEQLQKAYEDTIVINKKLQLDLEKINKEFQMASTSLTIVMEKIELLKKLQKTVDITGIDYALLLKKNSDGG